MKRHSGFTLVELIVTIAIFTVISTVILASYPRFANRLLFDRTVQEVAQHIRRAQTYSIGVREFGGSFAHPYGVYLTESRPRSYVFFNDLDGNFRFTPSPDPGLDEKIDEFELPPSMEIIDLCIRKKDQSAFTDCDLGGLHITYERPGPTSYFYSDVGPMNGYDVEIVFQNSAGAKKQIVVWLSGQVAVEGLEE